MIKIRFPDESTERRGLGFLVGRFSFKTWANGETLVPEAALSALGLEDIAFTVLGRATYEQSIPAVRGAPALQFNDGQRIPGELIADILIKLRNRFGAASAETQTIQGLWQHEGHLYRDELTRAFVDVPDTAESREFFVDFKEKLKAQFQQIDIWMTTYIVEVI